MTNALVVGDRTGSALSLALLLGGAVAGLSNFAVGAPHRNWPKATESVLKSAWSNYADSTHSLAFGLPVAARLAPLPSIYTSRQPAPESVSLGYSTAVDPKSWTQHVLDPEASTDVDILTETAELAFDHVASFGVYSLDLSNLDPKQVNAEHLATMLRALSTWRDEIPGWHKALEVNILAFQLAEIDPKEALFGMI